LYLLLQVTFPNPEKPNFAEVISPKSGIKYTIRDCYSMIPSCDCPWSEQGNMCKHQCKALISKGHQGGSIIQQCGTWAGSQYGGMRPIEQLLDNSHLLLKQEPKTEGLHDLPLGDVDHVDDAVNTMEVQVVNQRDIFVEKSREAWVQIEKMASQSDSIAQTTLSVMNRSLHDLKVQEQCQLATRKDVITTADMFVRPSGLTLKRKLGKVDFYHGGKRSRKIVKSYLLRKQAQKRERSSLVSNWNILM
jgi:hypothetical protein